MFILTVRNLSKKYDTLLAVDNISFQVKKGSIHGLVGPNGAGKSTTINMISGLLRSNSGEITFEDNISFDKWHTNIGLVPQELAIYSDLSAEENVTFFASLYGLKGNELQEQVNKALQLVGLEDRRKDRSDQFSGGMKRRLNIACAIVHKPKLIIMDEPTVGIDPQSRNFILESIKKLSESGTTVIYTSHYMEEVEELCDNLTIIDHGKIIMDGTKEDVYVKFNNGKKLMLSVNQMHADFNQIASNLEAISGVNEVKQEMNSIIIYCKKEMSDYSLVFEVLRNAHIQIIDIENIVPTLEDIFLSLTGKELRDS